MAFEVPQPMQYAQGENLGLTIGQGLGALGQGLGAIRQQEQEQQAKQQLQQFQSAFGQAYASGDRDAMKQLVAQYPGQFEQVQKGLTILNAENKENVGATAADLRLAAATGNKDAVLQAAEKNRATLEGLGATPESVVASFEQDPQQAGQFLDMIGLHALGPEKYFDVMDKRSQRDIQREGLDVQRRGQDITVRGQNISAQNAALDRQIRQAELQDKVLDRKIAQETNLAKLDELRAKQQEARSKAEQAKADKAAAAQGAVDTFSTALDSLDEITKSKGLKKAVGLPSALPTLPGSDAANFEANLDTFKAQTFLPMVASLKGMGALSDAEGKKLSEAVGALSTKMSEKAFRESAEKIRTNLENKLNTVKKQYNYQETTPVKEEKKSSASDSNGSQKTFTSSGGVTFKVKGAL